MSFPQEGESTSDSTGHGSDFQVNSQWWQASDLRWYPPELHADYVPNESELPVEQGPNAFGDQSAEPTTVVTRRTDSIDITAPIAKTSALPVVASSERSVPVVAGANRSVPGALATRLPTAVSLGTPSLDKTDVLDSVSAKPVQRGRPVLASALVAVSGILMCVASGFLWGSGEVLSKEGQQVAFFKVSSFDSNGEFTLVIGAFLMILAGLGLTNFASAKIIRWASLFLGVVGLGFAIFSAVDLTKLSERMARQWVQDSASNVGDQITVTVLWPVWAAIAAGALAVLGAFFTRSKR